jgi:hypothetical protein
VFRASSRSVGWRIVMRTPSKVNRKLLVKIAKIDPKITQNCLFEPLSFLNTRDSPSHRFMFKGL